MNKNPTHKGRSRVAMRETVKYLISFVIVAAGVIGFIVLKSFQKPPVTRPSTSLVPQVEISEVNSYAGQLDMEVTGTVVPYREIRVAAEVGGRVTSKSPACEAGQFVRKGELLLEIDPEEYRLEIETQSATVEQAKRRIEENQLQIEGEQKNIELAKSDLKLQQAEFRRNERLKDALSRSEVDRSRRAVIAAESALTLRRNNLTSLKAASTRLKSALDVSKRQLDKADLNLRRATVVAPEDGVIVNEMVQEGDFVARGTQLFTFEDTRQSEVLCNLTLSELNQIRKNAATLAGNNGDSTEALDVAARDLNAVYRLPKTPVTIMDPSNPSVIWDGVLERFDGIGVDSVTKTIPVRIAVKKPIADTDSGQFALVRGMFVRCRLEFHVSMGDGESPYLSIPEKAVQPNHHVWTVTNNRLKRKPIKVVDYVHTGPAADSMQSETSRLAIIARTENGPQTGDQVVVSPLSQPSDDSEVEIAGAGGQTDNEADTDKTATADDTEDVSIESAADSVTLNTEKKSENVR